MYFSSQNILKKENGQIVKADYIPPAMEFIPEKTITLLIFGEDAYLVYDKTHIRYKEIEREYKFVAFGQESSIKEHPCRICGKSDLDEIVSHKCADTRNRLHKACLKKYFADATESKIYKNKVENLCPFCENPIELSEILDESEIKQFEREKEMQKMRSARASSLSGYIPNLRKNGRSQEVSTKRESSREKLKRHEFICDLCGKNCEIDYINNKVFVHNDENCTGGCSHKECLIKSLTVHFWRKYEKYYGQRIILLTASEAEALKKQWVCPVCTKRLKESELRSLVTEREWSQQIEMRKKREKPLKERTALKKLLERTRIEESPIIEKATKRPVRVRAEDLLKKREKEIGWTKKTWEKIVLFVVSIQTIIVLYICWKYWCSMVNP